MEYEDYVEDCFPSLLKMEEQDKNTSYFGEGDYANNTQLFYSNEMVKDSLKSIDGQIRDCAKAFKDLLAVIAQDAHWSVRTAFTIRAAQRIVP